MRTTINLIPNKTAHAIAEGYNHRLSLLHFNKNSIAAFSRQITVPNALSEIIPGNLQPRTLYQFLFHPHPYPEAGFTRLKHLSAAEFAALHSELIRINEAFARNNPGQTRAPKMPAVNLMEKYWIEHGLAERNTRLERATLAKKEPMSLFEHAYKEWEIILGLLTSKDIPTRYLGIPAIGNIRGLLSLHPRLVTSSFKPINSQTFLFLEFFLLLHDLGKVNIGNNGHEARSKKIAALLLNDPRFNLSKDEKKLMIAMIGFHSEIDEITSSNASKAAEAKNKLANIFKAAKLPRPAAQEILQIWLLFRIAERAQSEHFGFFDESCIADILKLCEIASRTALS
jgi:hypothetical protein